MVGRQAGSPRRELMLSELAAELRAVRDEHRHDITRLRNDLGGLSTLVGDNADLLGQALPRVKSHRPGRAGRTPRSCSSRPRHPGQDVVGAAGRRAHGRRRARAARRGGAPRTGRRVGRRRREWQALGDWVAGVLGPFYELTRAQLPDCWPLHRPAVMELVWLRRTYVAAHTADATAAAAADWHTRWRREALANIAAAIPKKWCRPGDHWVDQCPPGTRKRSAALAARHRNISPGNGPVPGTQVRRHRTDRHPSALGPGLPGRRRRGHRAAPPPRSRRRLRPRPLTRATSAGARHPDVALAAAVAVAVVTSARGVLAGRRIDRRPPWTFPGGELEAGRNPGRGSDPRGPRRNRAPGRGARGCWASASTRSPPARSSTWPATRPAASRSRRRAARELAEVRWLSAAEADELLPDMYPPVRTYVAAAAARHGF